MNNDLFFSSKSEEWATPQDFFEQIDKEFHFNLDACATAENAKCDKYYTKEQDGLSQEWNGIVWCNPPYGRSIGMWVKKAYESKATVVLVPLAVRLIFISCIQLRRFCRGGGTSSVSNVITAEKRSCFCAERLKVGKRRRENDL